jgi:N-acetyl-1-D-myo-inositol-2-amino-2-deoxy-alpha-D-glucopyranoside deacetylase
MAQQLVLMAVHAHPDDEAVGMGGTLALYAGRGARTVLVTCTRGEEGEIVDPELKAQIADSAPSPEVAQERLADVRDRELAESVRVLRITQFYQLGYRDSGMAGTPSNDNPCSFNKANLTEAAARLIALVRRERPHVLVTYNAYGGYGHPDHINAHRITELAFAGAANTEIYPLQDDEQPWQPLKLYHIANSRDRMLHMAKRAEEQGIEMGWGARAAQQEQAILRGEPVDPEHPERPPFGDPEDTITTFIDIRPVLDQKRASLLAHRTQAVSTNRFMAGMSDEQAREIFGTEFFRLVHNRVKTTWPEDDLFAGIALDS